MGHLPNDPEMFVDKFSTAHGDVWAKLQSRYKRLRLDSRLEDDIAAMFADGDSPDDVADTLMHTAELEDKEAAEAAEAETATATEDEPVRKPEGYGGYTREQIDKYRDSVPTIAFEDDATIAKQMEEDGVPKSIADDIAAQKKNLMARMMGTQ
jgi:hypothetical protein